MKPKGFTLIEVLLLILVVSVIGFAGYYVWHNQAPATKTVNKVQTQQPSVHTEQSTSDNFIIKEWGVKAAYSNGTRLTYMLDMNNTVVRLTSSALVKADSQCTADASSGGLIARYKSGDHYYLGDGGVDAGTIEHAIADGSITSYGHVGSYYYVYEHTQALCGGGDSKSEIDTIGDLQGQAAETAKELVKNLQPV